MNANLLDAKISRIRELLAPHDAEGILLTTTANFAWLTGGRDNHGRLASDLGASSLLVTPDAHYLVANAIEGPRVVDEELEGQGYRVHQYPWHESSPVEAARSLAGAGTLLSDTGMAGTVNVDAEIAPHALPARRRRSGAPSPGGGDCRGKYRRRGTGCEAGHDGTPGCGPPCPLHVRARRGSSGGPFPSPTATGS